MLRRWLATLAVVLLAGSAFAPPVLGDAAASGGANSEGPAGALAVKAVAAGPAATYVFLDGEDGLVLLFGGGRVNQPLLMPLLNVRQIADGPAGRFALLDSGQVLWEDTGGDRAEWRLLLDTDDVREIVVSESGLFLVRRAGALWFYDLASGTLQPVGLSYIRQVVAGDGWYLALANDGQVYGIGDNTYGVLGAEVGPAGAFDEWTRLPVSGVKAIAGGGHTAYFLLSDGSIVGLGSNAYQTLGTKASAWTGVPTQIPFGATVEAIAASPDGRNLYALTSGREVYGIGANDSGQLGSGSGYHAVRGVPVKLGLKNVVAVAAGNGFVVTLDGSGNLRGMGRTSSGQLGTASPDPYFGFDTPRTLRIPTTWEALFDQALSRAQVRPDYLPVARRLLLRLPRPVAGNQREIQFSETETAVAQAAEQAVGRAEQERTLEALLAARELVAALRADAARPLLERLEPVERDLALAGDRLPPAVVSVTLDGTALTVTATDSAQYPYAASGVKQIRMRLGDGAWFTYTGPVLVPARPVSVFVQAVDARDNTSAVFEWSLDFAGAEEAVAALEGFMVTGGVSDAARGEEVTAAAQEAVEALVDGEKKEALRSRLAQAAIRVRGLLAAQVAHAAVKTAEEAVAAFGAGDPVADGDAVAAQLTLARNLLDARGWTDASLESRLSRAEGQFAIARARRLVNEVSANKVTTKSNRDEIVAYKWAVERAGLAVSRVSNPSVATSLNLALADVRAALDAVWADMVLDQAETALKSVADGEHLDEIEVLLGEARTAIGHMAAGTTRKSYERRLERAQSDAQKARVTLAIEAAKAAAADVTLENRSQVEALFETAGRLVERLGNATLRLRLKDAQAVLFKRLADLYLERAEKTLDPETIREAKSIVAKLSYAVRKPYEQRLEPLTGVLEAEEALAAVAARRQEWEKTLLEADLSQNRLPVTRAYSNYTSQASKAAELVAGLPKETDNPVLAKKADELRKRWEEQERLLEIAGRVMELERGHKVKDQKELKATVGVNWAFRLDAIYREEIRRYLGSGQPRWVNLTPKVITLSENSQVFADKPGTGVVIGWTDEGVLRFVIEVRD